MSDKVKLNHSEPDHKIASGKQEQEEHTMTHTAPSSEKLHEALELLNHAARDKGDELRQLMAGKYDDVKNVIVGAAEKSAAWAKKEGKAAVRLEAGAVKHVKQAAVNVDESAHGYPWPWIGGAALAGLLVGVLVNRRRPTPDA